MSPSTDLLGWLQVAVSVLTLGGVAFAVGRLYGRIDSLTTVVRKIETAMFGGDSGEGMFLRRSEAQLLMESATREHSEFDRRLTEVAQKVGALEVRRSR